MMTNSTTNWDLIRIQYELFHTSVPQIAHEHGLSVGLLEHAIEEKGWQRKEIAKKTFDLAEANSLEEITDELLDSVKQRLDIVSILKAEALSPVYIKLELMLLHKAIEITENLSAKSEKAANQLKSLTSSLAALLAQNSILQRGNEVMDDDDKKFIIQILNQVQVEKP